MNTTAKYSYGYSPSSDHEGAGDDVIDVVEGGKIVRSVEKMGNGISK